MLIDTHCHLNDAAFLDPKHTLKTAANVGVSRVVVPCISRAGLDSAISLANENSGVFFALGIHPCEISCDFQDLRDLLGQYYDMRHEKLVAIGECGLDFFHQKSPTLAKNQEKIFREQIEFALQKNLPLILHTRNSLGSTDAAHEMARILREYPMARGVFHCFDGTDFLLDFSENFCYGIGGVVTFKNAKILQEILPKIPKNRIILETDAPYLAPHPHRGKKNSPEFLPIILQKICEILQETPTEIAKITTKNAENLFGFRI